MRGVLAGRPSDAEVGNVQIRVPAADGTVSCQQRRWVMGDPKSDGDLPEADALAARLSRLETILELAPVGIGLVDFEGRTTMTNLSLIYTSDAADDLLCVD